MRIKTLVLASALAALSWPCLAQGTAPPRQLHASLQVLSLAEVWRLAEQASPTLRAKQAELAVAEGARADAGALLYNNPLLSLDQTRRQVPQDGASTERRREGGAGVQQTFEIAGQHYYRILALQQRVALEVEALGLFKNTAAAVQKRRTAGEDTKLDANVAAVEAERARNQLAVAREQLLDARAELAAQLQLRPGQLPQPNGDLNDTQATAAPYRLEDLLAQAGAQPRLRALQAREDAARARLKLENARRYPDLTVGVSVGREGGPGSRERLTTIAVSVPLPLFNHNAAGIGQASTELTQAEISRDATVRNVQANVRTLWSRLESLRGRVGGLQNQVLPALLDNQQLSIKSQRAGQIGLLELIVVNRQALDARRDLIEALTDYQTTRLVLELAAGWSPERDFP